MKADEKTAKEIFGRAEDAFADWSRTDINDRVVLLKKLRLLIARRRDEIGSLISESVRKTQAEALALEVFPAILFIRYLEKNLKNILKKKKVKVPVEMMGAKAWAECRASGVALVIAPWNFPFYLSLIPALSAVVGGNTVVVKPSEYAVGIGEMLTSLFKEAGFPDGVFQCVEGDANMGKALMSSDFSRVFFTGSTKVGKIIAAQAAERLIPCVTELGGASAMIVFDDANIDRAVNGALFSAFAGCGQICVASKRLYVQKEIYEDFVSRLADKAKELTQGDLQKSDLGFVRLPSHYLYLKELIDDAESKGAVQVSGFIKKNSFSPVILKNVNHTMRIMKEEAFGPVLPVMSFDGSVEEAVSLANDTDFGLSASVWSCNKNKCLDVIKKLKAGLLSINDAISGAAIPSLPFGGVKQSGVGRSHGEEGVRFFMDEISCVSADFKANKEIFWFGYGEKYLENIKILLGFYAKNGSLLGILKAAFKLWRKRSEK